MYLDIVCNSIFIFIKIVNNIKVINNIKKSKLTYLAESESIHLPVIGSHTIEPVIPRCDLPLLELKL